ncbi:response regulator [Pendulispora brunnea]|uniref:Response regulator n=1 Tax=Pendulispora brunnea TaxID=2905690 RepID=A0ABZ2KBQ8_9BACT
MHKDSHSENAAAAAAPERSPQLAGIHVLVTDDHYDSRLALQIMLEQHGARVTCAESVADAISKLEQELPDVLISDIDMPVESGYDLIRRVRASPEARASCLPALALTGRTGAEHREQVLRAGFTMHVPKPVRIEELVAVLAALPRTGEDS